MLKQSLMTLLVSLLFAMTPALADHHDPDEHKGSEHPAHEMGEAENQAAEGEKKLKEEYKENIEEAKDAANAPHPAHEMGEEDVLDE